jgi:hypothetical protein
LDEDMLDSISANGSGEDLAVTHLEGQLGGISRSFEWPIRRKRKIARADLRAG